MWINKKGEFPLPSEAEHCQRLVEISEEDISSVVKSIPKLDTLILIKKMLNNKSFQNPFLSAIGNSSVAKSLASRISRLERFQNSRSNSAPGNYQNLAPCGSVAATADLNELESPVDWSITHLSFSTLPTLWRQLTFNSSQYLSILMIVASNNSFLLTRT